MSKAKQKKQTNADKFFRNATDEQIAGFLPPYKQIFWKRFARSWDIRKQSQRRPLLTRLRVPGLTGSERRRPTMKRLRNLLQEGLDWILLFLLLFLLRLGWENYDDLEGL